jgi:hypothetical protein
MNGTWCGKKNVRREQHESYKGLMLQNVVLEEKNIKNLTQNQLVPYCAIYVLLWLWLL